MTHPALTDPTTLTLIEKKVASLARTWGLSPTDADDAHQEFVLDLLERLPHYDPAKAPLSLFIAACVHRKMYNLVRSLLTQRRGPIRDSIDRLEEEHEATGMMMDTSAAELAGERDGNLRDLRVDLSGVLPDLTSEEQEVFRDLMSESVTEIARRTGRTRKMVYRVIASLREKLDARGLAQYVVP